jgi:hypothetical protein
MFVITNVIVTFYFIFLQPRRPTLTLITAKRFVNTLPKFLKLDSTQRSRFVNKCQSLVTPKSNLLDALNTNPWLLSDEQMLCHT